MKSLRARRAARRARGAPWAPMRSAQVKGGRAARQAVTDIDESAALPLRSAGGRLGAGADGRLAQLLLSPSRHTRTIDERGHVKSSHCSTKGARIQCYPTVQGTCGCCRHDVHAGL
eukprot:scaffold1065_cov406-Prasinococcus_capsulatus_cf.AAC.1